MEIIFNYYIIRKSDNKLMQILHEKLSEEEIIDLVRGKLTAPIHYNMDTEFENGEYTFSDITIDKVTGLS